MKPSFEKNSLVTNPPRVGVASLILRGGRVLLVQRKHSHGAGSWSTPGGHLEHGETPEACAIRETREEVGLEVTAVRFLAVTNDIFDTEGKHYITIWMQAVCERGEPRIAAEDEVAALAGSTGMRPALCHSVEIYCTDAVTRRMPMSGCSAPQQP